jgi:hypothetical protein
VQRKDFKAFSKGFIDGRETEMSNIALCFKASKRIQTREPLGGLSLLRMRCVERYIILYFKKRNHHTRNFVRRLQKLLEYLVKLFLPLM